MPKLSRLICTAFGIAAALATVTLSPSTASANNIRQAFASVYTTQMHRVEVPRDMPRAKTLRFVGAEPAPIHNGPEQVYLARSRQQFSQNDLACMSEALYFEARGEGTQGQAAVAEVILNRVDSRQFPRTVCGVVNQTAQFSYTIGGKKRIGNQAAYRRARTIAEAALAGAPRNLTGGATYFHTTAVRPYWSRRFQRTTQIGRHIFYRTGGQRVASN